MNATPPAENPHRLVPKIITKLIECFIDLHIRIGKFPKRSQYTIGKRLEDLLLQILNLVMLARAKSGRSELLLLQKIDIFLKEFLIILRIADGTKALTINGYVALSKRIIEIGKITGGWIKNTKAELADKTSAL